jgi:nitroreductase
MDFYEVIQARRSARKFATTIVESDKLKRIWTAVQAAPSACNLQPWKFLVLRSPESHEKIRKVFHGWVTEAPLVIVALGNRQAAWRRDGESIHAVDVAIAMEHFVLAATKEGLGTCWVCAFDRRALSTALNLAPEWDPVAVTPLGYSTDPSPMSVHKNYTEFVEER